MISILRTGTAYSSETVESNLFVWWYAGYREGMDVHKLKFNDACNEIGNMTKEDRLALWAQYQVEK